MNSASGSLFVEPGHTGTSFESNATDADSLIGSYATVREHVKDVLVQSVQASDDPAVAATSRTPKLRYSAGPLARLLSRLKRFAPASLLDKGIRKANKLAINSQPAQVAHPETNRV